MAGSNVVSAVSTDPVSSEGSASGGRAVPVAHGAPRPVVLGSIACWPAIVVRSALASQVNDGSAAPLVAGASPSVIAASAPAAPAFPILVRRSRMGSPP